MSDLISRQAAIDAIMGEPTDAHYPSWYAERLEQLPSAQPEQRWIPCSERLPETDNKNSINNYNGKLRHIDGDDGSGNFWGVKTQPCDWTIWEWCYFNEPEVIAWMPLPEPYKTESELWKK